MKSIHFLLTFLLVLTFVSCDRIQTKIDQVSDELRTAEKKGPELSQEKWLKLEQLINELETDLSTNRDKFTEEQLREYNTLKGRYTALKIKRELRNFKNSMKDFKHQLEGAIEELMEDSVE